MRGITHILIALVFLLFFKVSMLFNAVFIIFTLLPDIDSSNSIIGRRLYPISKLIEFLFGHRGIFHGILIPLTVSIILLLLGLKLIAIAAFLGYLLHLLVDAMTISGVNIFGVRIKGFIKTDGIIEFVIDIILLIIIVLEFYII